MALQLFMVLIGCKPDGRHTEQHDIYFGIAHELKELVSAFEDFWPDAKGKMHVDGWRAVEQVNGMQVSVIAQAEQKQPQTHQLFFINLGGYKQNEFEEFHYKMIVAARDKSSAIQFAKETAFFKHTYFEGANSHIDDKYGVDVDDIYDIEEILSDDMKSKYTITLSPAIETKEDKLHVGYFKLNSL
jgi:hypothetical protein